MLESKLLDLLRLKATDAGQTFRLQAGYEVLQDERIPEGRLIKEIKLHEISLTAAAVAMLKRKR